MSEEKTVIEMTEDEKEGVAAIKYLQGMADIPETDESAIRGWRGLRPDEQKHTVGLYRRFNNNLAATEKKKEELKMKISDQSELQFTLKSGTSFNFEKFEPKQANQIKVNINRDGSLNGEGCWACISDDDLNVYMDNTTTDVEMTRVCILRNKSLAGPLWGEYLPYKLNGNNRPSCGLDLIDVEKSPRIYNQVDTIEKEKKEENATSEGKD